MFCLLANWPLGIGRWKSNVPDETNVCRSAQPAPPRLILEIQRARPTAGGSGRNSVVFADQRVIWRSVRNLPSRRAKGGQRGATDHRDAHRTVNHRRTISARVSERPRTDAARPSRSRPRVEQDGDRGAREHRPGALGAHRGSHRSAPSEGQPHQRIEDFMKSRLAASCLAALLLPALAAGQPAPRSFTERLSLETAVRLAVEHNRQLLNAQLQVEQAEDTLAIVRTRRLPAFQTEVSISQLVTPVDFSFPRGAFGEFPGTGPIPATDTNVSVSRQPTAYASSQISQPISKLFEIGVSIRSAAAGRDIAQERARAEQLAVVNQVKRRYFAILQTESALDADEEAIALYRELDRTLQMRVAQQVALRADALDVRVQLARAELAKTTRQNGLASQKEQLNQLLGRDVRTDFDVETVSAVSLLDVDLRAAQTRALESRPGVREPQLALERADLDRRLAAADRIPEVSLAASYMSNFNVDMLPRNLASVGLTVKWEPFDWGRKGHEVASRTRAVQ